MISFIHRKNITVDGDSIERCNVWVLLKKGELIRASPMHEIWQNSSWKWTATDQHCLHFNVFKLNPWETHFKATLSRRKNNNKYWPLFQLRFAC